MVAGAVLHQAPLKEILKGLKIRMDLLMETILLVQGGSPHGNYPPAIGSILLVVVCRLFL